MPAYVSSFREKDDDKNRARKKIHQLQQELKQKEMLVKEVFENVKQQQRLAVEREVQDERGCITQLEQQLAQN